MTEKSIWLIMKLMAILMAIKDICVLKGAIYVFTGEFIELS